jgi:HK97 family phage major capsid protein
LTNYGAQAEALLIERQKIWEQRKAVTDSLKDGETPSAEQRGQLDAMDADLNRLGAEARSIVEEGERERDAAELRQRAIALGAKPGVFTGDQQPQGQSGPSLSDEIRALNYGETITIGSDLYMKPGQEARAVLAAAETRVATTGVAANAGATIPTTFVARVLEYMLPNIGVWQAGPTIITTSSGNPMTFPRLTGRPTVAPVAENTAFPTSDAAFNQFTLGAKKYGVIVQVSKEMVEDSGIDIAGFIAQQAGIMAGRQVAHDLLVGSGTGGTPTGVLTAAVAANAGTTMGTIGAISGDDIIALYYSIIDAYRGGAKFLMADATVGKLRGVKDAYGQYLWQPGLVSGAPDMLLGKPVVTDINMPTVATGNNAVLFGDFSKYYVRQVNGVQVEKSFEYGWGSDLVSYKVTWRGDGGLSDTTGALKTLVGK